MAQQTERSLRRSTQNFVHKNWVIPYAKDPLSRVANYMLLFLKFNSKIAIVHSFIAHLGHILWPEQIIAIQ